MKREKSVTFFVGLALACLLSFGAMGAMISGLNLPVENLYTIYIAWLVSGAVGCALFSMKKGWIPALVLLALGFSVLTKFPDPWRALITRLSAIYDSAYQWGVWEFAGVAWQEIPADLPLLAWGCFIAFAAAATVVWGHGLILTVIAVMLPLTATVVVTNTPPDAVWLFCLMLGLILLLLTATVRRHDPRQGAKLALLTALPVAVLLGGLFLACPSGSYVNRSEEYLNSVTSWWQSGFSLSISNGSGGLVDRVAATPNASATANLSRVGPRNVWAYKVMDVEADFSDTVYLRGQDFDSYSGGSWTATTAREESFGGTQSYGNWVYKGVVNIYTSTASNVMYLPYYPTVEQWVSGGRMENGEGLREYGFGIRQPQNSNLVWSDAPILSLGSDAARYTGLPSDTRRWAVWYLQENFTSDLLNSADDSETANAIADHVRGSAVYDTDTPRMSGEYTDFVQWFLEESDRGYCVHFASATAVLLRAAGVPARYVTGYMVETEADRTVEVTADQAHAWVEYYDKDLGAWIVLESTPADLRGEEDQPETQPLQTEPPTEPPTQETEAPTRPDGTPAPTEPQGPKIDLTPLLGVLKWLLLPLALWLAVLVQYGIRRSLRRYRGKPNHRALAKWRDVELLCRVTRQELPEELEALAQKAKFSQHTLSKEELSQFDAWLKAARSDMKHRPWYIRFLCRYVLVVC